MQAPVLAPLFTQQISPAVAGHVPSDIVAVA
jgi:hypothetical protein